VPTSRSPPRGTGAASSRTAAPLGAAATLANASNACELGGDARKEKKQRHVIDQLENHFIICGYGRVGRRAADEFEASGQPFVVLDTGEEAIDVAKQRGVLYLRGSGCDDGVREEVDERRAPARY